MAPTFRRATRQRVPLKIAITGPSGSGKTYSALELAFGLANGGPVALIDTENESASLYAGLGAFDTLNIHPPYTIAKYAEAIDAAVSGGYPVLIVDSLTHAWAGEGGLLAKKEAMDARGGNSFSNWAGITKEHEALKAKILSAPIHIIATMRSKQDYVLTKNDKGKETPKKVGLAPVQREGLEYEFTTVFDVDMSHNAATSKDRTGLFDGLIERITRKTGAQILAWLESGAEPQPDYAALRKEAIALLGQLQSEASAQIIYQHGGAERFRDVANERVPAIIAACKREIDSDPMDEVFDSEDRALAGDRT